MTKPLKPFEDFVQGYIEAMLFTELDDKDESLEESYGLGDVAQESFEAIVKDCKEFMEANPAMINLYVYQVKPVDGGSPYAYAGHDFWLTRNGQGCGFWDRDGIDEEVGNALSEASKSLGSRTGYVGDDGRVYVQ